MLMSERVVQKQRGVPGCISAALLFDSDFFFFFFTAHSDHSIYRIKYTVVMLRGGGEKNTIGENGFLLLGIFIRVKNTF